MITFKLGISGSPRVNAAKQYNLTSLANSRQVRDLEFVCKVVNGLIDCPEILERIGFKIPVVNSRTDTTFCIICILSSCISNHD